jgi:gamma-glutamyltranspeptidase
MCLTPTTSRRRCHRYGSAGIACAVSTTSRYTAQDVYAGLLSEEYAEQRRALFDATKAKADVEKGSPPLQSNTVSFQVVDGEGNAVSMVNSNYMGFGTGLTPDGCGFSLQNRGANFVLEEGHPNELKGGKRPYHTIIPAMALQDGELYCSFTLMGGFMQPQGHVQVMLSMIDFKVLIAPTQSACDVDRRCADRVLEELFVLLPRPTISHPRRHTFTFFRWSHNVPSICPVSASVRLKHSLDAHP